jgi:hypothetical protein
MAIWYEGPLSLVVHFLHETPRVFVQAMARAPKKPDRRTDRLTNARPTALIQTGVFKLQIDWIPLSVGSVRPTQGRTLAIAQVCGGSQSFNAVNSLRILGRWMRMFTIPNQSSVPRAYTQFAPEAEGSRMLPGPNRDRLVDCMEELVKYTIMLRPHFHLLGDRFSERDERERKMRAEEEEKKEKAREAGLKVSDNGE